MPRRDGNWVRQRAEQFDVRLSHEAIAAVIPIRSKVGDWHSRGVRLRALMARRRAAGQSLDEIAEAAKSVLEEIEQGRLVLEQKSKALPPEVARHSRFQDVVRALDSASAVVRSVLHGG